MPKLEHYYVVQKENYFICEGFQMSEIPGKCSEKHSYYGNLYPDKYPDKDKFISGLNGLNLLTGSDIRIQTLK